MPPATEMLSANCPVCGQPVCENMGEILHAQPTLVAGVRIDLGESRFWLLRCSSCGFQFKHPPVPERALLDCYRRAEGGHWGERPDPDERQFDRIREALERAAPMSAGTERRRVLDIGCFNGALLEYLGDGWEKHGVEPSAQAAALARERGIDILGATIHETIPAAAYDAALAIDVVEHIPDPAPFFRLVARMLRPEGVCLILTGDTDSPPWRWQRSRYWYCSMPEHVSFFCRSALERLANDNGMVSIEQQRMSHIRAGLGRRTTEAAKNLAYGVVQRVGWLPGRSLRRRVLDRRAPGWLTARDHLLHIMRRR